MATKSSSTGGSTSRAKVRNATLMNLLATPGLGSLMVHRWVEGIGQLILSVTGFVLVVMWFVQIMGPYYGQMFSDAPPPPPVGYKMLVTGGVLFAVAWVWSLITSIRCQQQEETKNQGTLMSNENPAGKPANAPPLLATSQPVPNWQRQGEIIWRKFQFKDFVTAMKFVNDVAQAAEQMQHHPDIDIRWNKVTLALTTHDAGGLTEKDFTLARQCNALAGG